MVVFHTVLAVPRFSVLAACLTPTPKHLTAALSNGSFGKSGKLVKFLGETKLPLPRPSSGGYSPLPVELSGEDGGGERG